MAFLAGIITFAFTVVMAIAGLGAAFILIPVFMALGVEVHTAMATALLLNAISMAVASATFIRRKLVVWRIGVPILIVATALAPVGAHVSLGLDRTLLLRLFVGFLVFAAAMMLFYSPRERETTRRPLVLVSVGSGVGAVAGFFGGLLGVGGGNFVVPTLVTLGIDAKRASATTSVVVVFASLSGFLAHMSLAGVNWPLLGWTALGSIGGAALGARLMSDRLKGRQVKVIIGIVLLAVAVKMAWGLF
ncbi:MAG: sulfite exporter TauE/SafE family protein [Gemmatimonadetes bacterium]|nr:sulfite exporter TauE/SafE family protein [Gemmatimonadota bacterium]